MAAPAPSARFSLNTPPDLLQALRAGGNLAAPISRNEALQVPAVQRGRNLICGSLGTLPLTVHGPDRSIVTDTTYLVGSQIDQDVANSVVMAQTVEDMLFHGIGWWRVTKFGWHGYPVEARWVPYESVLAANSKSITPSRMRITDDELFPAPGDGGRVYIDGYPVPDKELIRFDSPIPPFLRHAARAIRGALQLDQTAALYAQDPLPLGYFAPAPDAEEMPDAEIQQTLDDWDTARRTRAWAYINKALVPNTLQWNPEQLQLASARQHAVLEIARALGVDPEYLGVSTTSRTYANIEDQRQDLITFTLQPFITAIQDRLSMRDVLPRGYTAHMDLGGFLRADTATRMSTYQTGLAVGAYTKEEIRVLEDKPPLTPAQQAATQPPAPPQPQPPAADSAPAGIENDRKVSPMRTERFAAGEAVVVSFDAAHGEQFQVDTDRRTVTGLMLPWGAVANNGAGKWRFKEGSVQFDQANVSRVKLNMNHTDELVGVATRLQSGRNGLTGTFKLGRGPAADQALKDAEDGILDGFSVEVTFEHPDDYAWDPSDDDVRLVDRSTLRGAALTGTPAFDDARLTGVKASRDSKEKAMGDRATVDTNGPAPVAVDFDAHLGTLAAKMGEAHTKLTETLAEAIGDSISAGFKAALEDITTPQGSGPQPVRASRFTITREEPVYSLNGGGHSLVKDAYYSVTQRDGEAAERLRRFRMQTDDLAKFARSALSTYGADGRQNFTTITTSNASSVIPPGYRPDLFVPMLAQGRPMVNACSQGAIENATPFVVPLFTSFSGATVTNSEGSNPTDGSLTLGTKTVTPTAISGRLVLSREIVDSANPAIDQIALNAMRESYARQTETNVYTLLNGANGAGGTITAGFVPSGAQAATFAGTGGTPFPEAALVKGWRQQLAKYPFARFGSPGVSLMGQNATSIIAGSMDSTGRSIFPSIGAMNSSGLGNAYTQGWSVDGLPAVPAWAMTGVAAGDSQILMINPLDAWVWESPTLLFRFEEKQGPALIELALFGYFGNALLRPVGVSGIRIT